jgi:tetratricopeptide (TPR) repeat protein
MVCNGQLMMNRNRNRARRYGHFFALLAVVMTACLGSLSAPAQEELKDNREIEERRESTQTMSELVYRRLTGTHEHLGEDELGEALDGLRILENMRLNKYEEALVHQTYGFVYVRQDKQQAAIASFEKCLALNALPNLAQQGMLYSLAGLYAANEKYLKSIETMRVWFQFEPDPPARAYMVIGSSFTELEKFDDALPYVQKAIQKSEKPRENWYLLELAIHYEKKRFQDVVAVVRTVLQYWPDKVKYWEILFGAYLQLGEDKNALDALMVAYAKQLIVTEGKIMSVVQMNMALDIPFTAGSVLEDEISAGNVKSNKKNLDILLQAWLSAREFERAIATIDNIAPLVDDGEYYVQKANIYNEMGEWQKVADSARQALDAGLKKPADAHMLAGMAYSELDRYADSMSAFRRARELSDERGRKAVDAWIAFLEEKMFIADAPVASSY